MSEMQKPLLESPKEAERFWAKVRKTGGCWLWQGTINSYGYGKISIGNKVRLAHRVAYQTTKGRIPQELQIDHLCRVRHCVNPSHMELVTVGENIKRGLNYHRSKTQCIHGHAFDAKNTRINKLGYRKCRLCCKLRERVRRSKRHFLAHAAAGEYVKDWVEVSKEMVKEKE